MPEHRCAYPDGNVPWDIDSIAKRVVTITIDPEDGIDILKELRRTVCPNALKTVGEAIVHA